MTDLVSKIISLAYNFDLESDRFQMELSELQEAIGQNDGGLAGVIFTEVDDTWRSMLVNDRIQFLTQYVQKELMQLSVEKIDKELDEESDEVDWEAQLASAIKDREFGDIRSILDEYAHPCADPEPQLSELNGCTDAHWSYSEEEGWGYVEYE